MKISPKQYAQILYELTDGKSSSEIENAVSDFACYLHKERKLKLSDKIIEKFGNIYNIEKGIVEAEVVSQKKLNESEMKKIKQYVAEKYSPRSGGAGKAKEVILTNNIDEKIKGGIILRVGDEVLDGGIAGKLGELRKILTQN